MSAFVSHSVFIVATWIAAIFGGVGLAAAFISAIVGYQLTEESLADANTKIAAARSEADTKIGVTREEARVAVEKATADANTKIAEARADTAKAVADTARANERAAELERQAAQLRIDLARLNAQAGWRTLTADQIQAFRTFLAGKRFAVQVNVMFRDDPECVAYARAIQAALNAAGLLATLSEVRVGGQYIGVGLSGTGQEELNALRGAFNAAGISIGPNPLPSNLQIGGVYVFVGARPPP